MAVVTMTKFTEHGRFANQIFQAMFLKLWATRTGSDLQLPHWCGFEYFDYKAAPLSDEAKTLPVWKEDDETPDWTKARITRDPPQGGFNYEGYAQYPTDFYLPFRSQICEWFHASEALCQRVDPLWDKLQGGGDSVVIGIHLRRGDYGRGPFWITPVAWYKRWLKENWQSWGNAPKLFISTETPELVQEFAEYSPQTVRTLGAQLSSQPVAGYRYLEQDRRMKDPLQMDFILDWSLLRECHVLLIPNSTFSFTAAMLSPRLLACYRATLAAGDFEPTPPWNAQPFRYESVDDPRFAHLLPQGVRLDSNPYWK